MMQKTIAILIVLTCLCQAGIAQVKPERSNEEKREQMRERLREEKLESVKKNSPAKGKNRNQEVNKSTDSNARRRSGGSQASNRRSSKSGSAGKAITIKHKEKRDKQFAFKEGDRVVVKMRDGETYRGKIQTISDKDFTVADSTIQLPNVALIKRSFLPVLSQKSAGTGLFIGGVVVTAGGAAIGYYATTLFPLGGPFIIATAAGIVAMLGIDIVGVSISVEGTKLIIKKTRFKLGDKWKPGIN